MKESYYQLILSLMWLTFSHLIQAQPIPPQQDAGLWLGVQLRYDVPKGFEVSLEQQLRTRQLVTKIDNYWAAVGVSYRINKNFKLAGHFRYIHEVHRWKGSLNSLRYNLDVQFSIPLPNKWRLSYRARYQQKFIDVLQRQKTVIALQNNTLRHRLKVRWKYNKIYQFYGLVALFVRTNPLTEASLHRFRASIGNKITTEIGQFNVAVGYERNLSPNDTFSFFFLKLIYQIEL
ncbi:MAG: DUF2490 domain-containing protein [Aureispira sp.]